jgi:F-type H+-transporting ATPase subunit b
VELSWTTFFLEIINFLVLVWLLKRLFYSPVKTAIAQRRSSVEKTLQDAKSVRQEAEDLKSKYEGRLQEWEGEKARQQEELRKEISAERTQQLKLLETSLAIERQKAEAQEEREAAEQHANDEKEAIKQALEFTARLLIDLASPETEGRIVDLVTKKLSSERAEDLPVSRPQSGNHWTTILVRSAYSLSEPQRQTLAAALRSKFGSEPPITFEVDQTLVAGVEVSLGAFVLRANLRDELEYFSTMSTHEHS